jgi:hypothetical protein
MTELDPRALEAAARALHDATEEYTPKRWDDLAARENQSWANSVRDQARAAVSAYLDATGDGRLAELERENARLREALKPFAQEAVLWDDLPEPPDEDRKLWIGSHANRFMTDEARFSLADLRRARAALAGSGEK